MKKTSVFVMFFLLAGLMATTASTRAASAQASINEAYDNGEISINEKARYLVMAIKNPERLPAEFQSLSAMTDHERRGATLMLVNIRQVWDSLDNSTRDYVTQSLARVTTAFTYISPSGYFKLHYDVLGPDAVDPEDLDASTVPDYVEKCAAYMDTSLTKHRDMGYLDPPNDGGAGGDTLYDVYFEDMSYYGYAAPENPGPAAWDDYTSYLVLHNTFIGFPPNNDPEGNWQGAAKATAAHEFHHSVQFGYNVFEDVWIMESDATCLEDLVFDHVDDNYNYLPSFFANPQISLLDNSSHAYSCFIWEMFLATNYGEPFLVSMWEGARYSTVFNSISDTLQANYNVTQDSAFVDFTFWNYITASNDDGLHYEEASQYPAMTISRTHSTYPVILQNSPTSIPGYASTYIRFFPSGTPSKLSVTFNGSDSRNWRAYLIATGSGPTHTMNMIPLDPTSEDGTIEIDDFHTLTSVTLVGVNVDEFSSAALFTYKASEIPPYEVTSKFLSTDTVVYSGGSRDLLYQINNPGVINDVFDVIIWDSKGWVTPDTIDISVFAGDSTTVAVPVTPSVGTALDQLSFVYAKAVSWNDPLVVDSQQTHALTVLQRGDVDFSGQYDISDLLYFVDFLFDTPAGPAPQPILMSGDYTCNFIVDISDLLLMVDHFFLGSYPCPCNPY